MYGIEPTDAEIVESYRVRKEALGPFHAKAKDVTDTYNGDLVIPLPELDKNERRAVPNLLAQGLNQMAMRISSSAADVHYPSLDPGDPEADENARICRQANLGWWEASDVKLMLARRARHLIGYASTPVVVRFNMKTGVPRWEMRHPLCTYPGETLNPDDVNPPDCIFTFTRTLAWLKRNYPDQFLLLNKGQNWKPTDKVELLEYMDDCCFVLIVLGAAGRPPAGQMPYCPLERVVNRGGLCPAIVPGRVTLDRPAGAYDGMVGLYQQQAQLMALEVIAVRRGIFQNEWLVARQNENPVIVQEADGLRGVTGVVRGGTIENQSKTPGYKTDMTIAQLERAQRLESGIPAEFGGESTTNVRTGRRGDSILSAVVDFPIQEAHHILEASMAWENKVAVSQAKAYAGNQPKSFYVNSKGAKGTVKYTPNKNFQSDSNVVTFPHAGADINSLIIGIGQMIGVGLISTELGRELNPMIEDPQQEHQRVLVESLESSILGGLQQAAVQGTLAPNDLARIMQLVGEDHKTLVEAVMIAQKEAQERQSQTVEPVPAGAPEAQAGLAPAGMAGAEAGTIGPTEDTQGLAQLMTSLKYGSTPPPGDMAVPA